MILSGRRLSLGGRDFRGIASQTSKGVCASIASASDVPV
jgi:hypothetical protein